MTQRMEDRLKPEEYIGLAADLESDYLEVKHFLVSARREQGITQNDIASFLGLSDTQVREFEQYDYDPRISELHEYAIAVGVRINPDPKRISESSVSYFTDNKDAAQVEPVEVLENERYTKMMFIENIAA